MQQQQRSDRICREPGSNLAQTRPKPVRTCAEPLSENLSKSKPYVPVVLIINRIEKIYPMGRIDIDKNTHLLLVRILGMFSCSKRRAGSKL